MNKKTIIKIAILVIVLGGLIVGGVILYLFNMPHRDIQSAKTDLSISANGLVNEFLTDAAKANDKYLDEEGESKILEVTGVVASIGEDFNGNKEILLKSPDGNAGVSCAFTPETNAKSDGLTIGQTVTIKGVIQSGAAFDADLEMYENVIMDKCDITKK